MVMSDEIDYGKLTKRIVFTDTDHRHAQLLIRLRHDSLGQADFFRHIVGGYIGGDERLQAFIDEVKGQSKRKKIRSQKSQQKGRTLATELGLSDQEVDNIFDILAEEHTDL
jgi:hypothetical protein